MLLRHGSPFRIPVLIFPAFVLPIFRDFLAYAHDRQHHTHFQRPHRQWRLAGSRFNAKPSQSFCNEKASASHRRTKQHLKIRLELMDHGYRPSRFHIGFNLNHASPPITPSNIKPNTVMLTVTGTPAAVAQL